MTIHSSILAWRIPWTEEPGGLQSMGSKKWDTTERLTHPHSPALSWVSTQPEGRFSTFRVDSRERGRQLESAEHFVQSGPSPSSS